MKKGNDGIVGAVELVERAAFKAFQDESPDVDVPSGWRAGVMAAVRREASQVIPFPAGIDSLLMRTACAVAVLALVVFLAASSAQSMVSSERGASLGDDIQSLYGDDYASEMLLGGGGME